MSGGGEGNGGERRARGVYEGIERECVEEEQGGQESKGGQERALDKMMEASTI